jgi:hypothetical protein
MRAVEMIKRGMLGGGAAFVPWYLDGPVPAANCVGAYKSIGASSLAASYINLASPGNRDLTLPIGITAPGWDALSGWSFDGTTQVLGYDTNIGDNYSFICKFSDRVGDSEIFGNYPPIANFMVVQYLGGLCYYNHTDQTSHAGTETSGVIAVTDYGYFNGVSEAGPMNALASAAPISIGGVYTSSHIPRFAGKIQAFGIYNILLTPAQVLAITIKMQGF